MNLVNVECVRFTRAIFNRPLLEIALVDDNVGRHYRGIECLWRMSLFCQKKNSRGTWMFRIVHLFRKVKLALPCCALIDNSRSLQRHSSMRTETLSFGKGRFDCRLGRNNSCQSAAGNPVPATAPVPSSKTESPEKPPQHRPAASFGVSS